MKTGKSPILVMCILLTFILAGGVYGREMESFFKTVHEPTRNDYTGVTGFEFTTNEEINVLALGRPITTVFKQEHTITLWRVADKKRIAEVVVGPKSPEYKVKNGSYAYKMLESPVKLPKGETYRLASAEFAGGDNWATHVLPTPGEDITDVAVIIQITWGPAGAYPDQSDIAQWKDKVDVECTFFYGTLAVISAGKLCTTWAKLKHGSL